MKMIYLCGCILLFSTLTASMEWMNFPVDQAVINNTDVRLDCVATEERETLIYEWRFNGSTVQDKTSRFSNNSLLIPKFTSSDVGHYGCHVLSANNDNSSIHGNESKTGLVILAYIDKFQLHPKSVRATINMTVSFECITGLSAPLPDVYWHLNGKLFLGGTQLKAVYGGGTGLSRQMSMKLVFNMTEEYAGLIRCVAVNTVLKKHIISGDASVFLTRTVSLPKIITPPPREVTVPVNNSLVLNCGIEGQKVYVLWYKNDVIIDGTSTSYQHSNGSMIFVRVLMDDAGVYYCQGKNTAGTVTSNTCNLTVAVLKEDFSVEPIDAEIFAGQTLTLNCIPPISVPPAKVTWYKDQQPLVIADDPLLSLVDPNNGIWSLHFTSVQKKDEGSYICVAENVNAVPARRKSQPAVITVQGAPIFIEPPLSQRVIKGKLLQMFCRVDGTPTPSVRWVYDEEILHSSNHISFRASNQELYVSNIGKANEGTYTCIAENIFGSKFVNATVKVIVPPVTLTLFGTITVTSGYTAVLPCDVYGDPRPVIRWFKDGVLIEEDDRRHNQDLTLNIINVTSSDAGDYVCEGYNEAGNASSNGSLIVLVPPQIVRGPTNTVVLIGQLALIACDAVGIPKPKVLWLYNGSRYLPEGVSFLPDRTTLKITPADWLHVGLYTCVVNNSVGMDMQEGTLQLEVPPEIHNIIGRDIVDTGETIHLDCAHKGTPTPSVTWIHQGEIINQTLDGRVVFPDRTSLQIKFSTGADAGVYECRISNVVGTATRSIHIYVIEPPKPPILTAAIPLSKSSVEMTWIPNSQEPRTNVTGYAVNYKKRPEITYRTFPGRLPTLFVRYEVEGLAPFTEYTFTISAENSAGIGLPSNAITVKTLETGPSEPINLRLLSVSATSAKVTWEVPHHQNGNIRKYQIQFRERYADNNAITEYEVEDILFPSIPNQEFDLLGLQPFTDYELCVRAANIQQEIELWGPFSLTMNFTTYLAAPSSAPTNITAVAVSPNMIKIHWQPPLPWHQNGPITGYRLKYMQQEYESGYHEIELNGSVRDFSLMQLSPWKNYSLRLEARNAAGFSQPSSELVVLTLPSALVVSPLHVKVSPESSTMLLLSWQLPDRRDWTCDITGSVIEYRKTGQTTWSYVNTSSIDLTNITISGLSAWQQYEVRVAVYTDQISPGLGPFTHIHRATTLPGLPGPVRNISLSSTNTSISAQWLAPVLQRGELLHYRVSYFATTNTLFYNDIAQEAPGISTSEKGPISTLFTNNKSIVIDDLVPATVYNISVAMATRAGEGASISLTIDTLATQFDTATQSAMQLSSELTTDTTFNTTNDMLTDSGGGKNRNLAVIVAGALTAGIFLIVIIIIIIWRCLKKHRAGRDHYMKSVISGVRITKRDSGSYDRQILDPSNIGEDDSATCNDSNDVDRRQRYGSFNSHQPVPQSPNSVDSANVVHSPSTPVKRSNSIFRAIRNSLSGDSVFTVSSAASGIDNPSYFDANVSATLPRRNPPPMTAEEVYSQAGATLRKNRMRSESAAAIAVMRSTGSLAVTTGDTETLIDNESVVVYNERTAL